MKTEIDVTGLRDRALVGLLFRPTGRKTGPQEMWQQDAYRMIQRRSASIADRPSLVSRVRHQRLSQERWHARTRADTANHSSSRTSKIYDRRQDDISFDEVERIAI
jgi:hypothetical protein